MGIFASALPRYSGRYTIGLSDIELSLSKPRVFGTTCVSSSPTSIGGADRPVPAFTYDTIFFSLYYPCDPAPARGVPWLTRPIGELLAGWLKFADRQPSNRIWSGVLLFATWCIGARLHIPAYPDAPFARPPKDAKKEKWPLVVFSHGLAGNRRVYSQYCGELASRGFVVAALEHRDGTAPTTSIFGRDGKPKAKVDYISYGEAM